jgi:hypothetical protein
VTISCGPVFSVSQASLSTCEKFCLFFIVLFFGKQKQKKTIKKKAVFQLVRSSALRGLTGTIVLFFFFIASRDLAITIVYCLYGHVTISCDPVLMCQKPAYSVCKVK